MPELAKSTEKSVGFVVSGEQMLEWHKHRLVEQEKKTRENLDEMQHATPFWLIETRELKN